MTNGQIIEQLENTIELIKQDGKDWLDDRDIPILDACIKSLTMLDKIRADFEWCTDCKEYDHDRHCCPRFNNVIRNTLNDSINAVLDEIKAEFKSKADGDDWYHTTDGLVWGEAMEIIDKHRQAESERV